MAYSYIFNGTLEKGEKNENGKNSCLTPTCMLHWFLPRCVECRRGLAMRILSVCPNVRPFV